MTIDELINELEMDNFRLNKSSMVVSDKIMKANYDGMFKANVIIISRLQELKKEMEKPSQSSTNEGDGWVSGTFHWSDKLKIEFFDLLFFKEANGGIIDWKEEGKKFRFSKKVDAYNKL